MASNLKDHKYANHEQIQAEVQDECSMSQGMAECVKDKPISSVAIAVGTGIGVGLLLTAMFSSTRRRREHLANRVGSYLSSGVSNMMPDSLSERFR